MRLLLFLLVVSCQSNTLTPSHTELRRTVELQQEVTQMIELDAENKRWAREYLSEIDAAMVNDDMPAYVFYISEYEKIPLETVPMEFRGSSDYVAGPSDLELYFRLRWFEQAVKLHKMYLDDMDIQHD